MIELSGVVRVLRSSIEPPPPTAAHILATKFGAFLQSLLTVMDGPVMGIQLMGHQQQPINQPNPTNRRSTPHPTDRSHPLSRTCTPPC
jgi:hypothetical protein